MPRSPISLFQAHISRRAIELVNQVLESGWVNEGEIVREFESRLAATLAVRNPVAVNSGTAALHLALAVAGVGPGDEVILPAQTFVATGLVVLMQRATPIFADIDPSTGNISPQSIIERVTPRTRAIIPVHWGGYPCDLDAINAIAADHDLTVVEDAAHALGAVYKGRPIGAVSRFTAFSFQAIKHLTTGDGGMVCCTNEADARDAFARRWFGIDRTRCVKSILGDRGCDIQALGYKYHMNNLAAAIGLGNLEQFPEWLARRRHIAALYRSQLKDVPGLELLCFETDREPAYWLFTVLVERREDFIRKLAERGIGASVVDLGIDRNSVFGGRRHDLPGQSAFDQQQISIPVHESLRDEDVWHIIETVRSGW